MRHLSADAVAEQLREYHGNLAAVARRFDVTRQAVQSFVRARPSLMAVLQECRETMKDHAESVLFRQLLAGEPWAVRFYLKTVGKDRGYVERQELTGADGGPLRDVTEVVVHSRAEAQALLGRLQGSSGGSDRNGDTVS
jgi:hypothetical protein